MPRKTNNRRKRVARRRAIATAHDPEDKTKNKLLIEDYEKIEKIDVVDEPGGWCVVS